MLFLKEAGVVAFAFGVPSSISPNRRIAEIATRKAKELHAPIYTQQDIDILDPSMDVDYISEEPGKPPPTLRVAKDAVQWAMCQAVPITELWIVAAGPHLRRVLRDMRYALRMSGAKIEIKVCEELKQYGEDSWFCPESTQTRVRSCKEWEKREHILMLLPMFIYNLVAS